MFLASITCAHPREEQSLRSEFVTLFAFLPLADFKSLVFDVGFFKTQTLGMTVLWMVDQKLQSVTFGAFNHEGQCVCDAAGAKHIPIAGALMKFVRLSLRIAARVVAVSAVE
jgi:hypothetical protein